MGIKTQTLAALAAVPFTLSCRGNGTPNPCRVSITLYLLSIPAIKLNGHTNHIANVFVKPEPQRSVEIAESISEIAHWHAPLSLTARWSSLIQNASNIQIRPNAWRVIKKPLTDHRRQQLLVPCWRIIILTENGTIKCFLWIDFTANKWQFVKIRLKIQQKGILQPNGNLFLQKKKPATTSSCHLCTEKNPY